jgi:uncharacterized membrane protein YgdD (TMEM256/DUF423 family)
LNREARIFLLAGCLAALAGVACGAFGAHALKARFAPDLLEVWQTAAAYHFYHALGLLAVGVTAALAGPSKALNWAGALMIAGLLLFSGSLYLLVLTGIRAIGAVTPLGGFAWMAAWALFAAAIWRRGLAN